MTETDTQLAALPEVLRHVVEPLQQSLFGRVLIDAEILRQAALVEPDDGTAAVNVERDDHVLERSIGPALKARRTDDRGNARLADFTKVMPRDYRRALEMKLQEETAEWRAAMGVQAAS